MKKVKSHHFRYLNVFARLGGIIITLLPTEVRKGYEYWMGETKDTATGLYSNETPREE